MGKFIFAAVFLTASTSLWASEIGQTCVPSQDNFGGLSVARYFTVVNGCLIQISPLAKPDLTYREYVIDERGALTVFVSTPGEDDNKSTGKRTFFFFPRKHVPSYELEGDQIFVTLSSDGEMSFSNKTTHLDSIKDGKFSESSEISLNNNGGVEITDYRGLMLDTGWELGHAAYWDKTRSSTFRDTNGKTCSVSNAKLFAYQDDFPGDPLFLYQHDSELADFLKAECPELDTSALKGSTQDTVL